MKGSLAGPLAGCVNRLVSMFHQQAALAGGNKREFK